MNDLIAFLRARLDEDEREANSHYLLKSDAPGHDLRQGPTHSEVSYHDGSGSETMTHAEYWQRFHDPAPDKRLLAEVDAKRRLIKQQFKYASTIDHEWGCGHDAEEIEAGECEWLNPHTGHELPILRLLAVPHADHPNYREDWRP